LDYHNISLNRYDDYKAEISEEEYNAELLAQYEELDAIYKDRDFFDPSDE
jgi:hypothetical protein